MNNDKIKGRAVKIDSDGALLVSTKSKIKKVLIRCPVTTAAHCRDA